MSGGALFAVGRFLGDTVERGERGWVVAKPPRGETLHPRALRRPRSAARRAGKRQAQRILVVILDIIGPGDLLRPFGAPRGAELVDGRIEPTFGARRKLGRATCREQRCHSG